MSAPAQAEESVALAAASRCEREDPGDFLESPLSDALCVGLFAGGAGWLRAAVLPLLLVPAGLRAPLGLGLALLGPLACGVERGRLRAPGWGAAALLGLLTGLAHLLTLRILDPHALAGALLVQGLGLTIAGALAARYGVRLDRDEAGWRAALRRGPPTGTPPLAGRIAALRGPRPLELVLLPLSWAARLPALLAIRVYQLTLSRLMPSACRFEPTCSRYGFLAFRRHGCVRGGLLTGLRVLRCSPLSDGGLDPVPPIPGRPGLSEARVSSPGRAAAEAGGEAAS